MKYTAGICICSLTNRPWSLASTCIAPCRTNRGFFYGGASLVATAEYIYFLHNTVCKVGTLHWAVKTNLGAVGHTCTSVLWSGWLGGIMQGSWWGVGVGVGVVVVNYVQFGTWDIFLSSKYFPGVVCVAFLSLRIAETQWLRGFFTISYMQRLSGWGVVNEPLSIKYNVNLYYCIYSVYILYKHEASWA